MAVTVAGTQITFNDGTTQSTAPSTTLYAVGTYIIGRPAVASQYAVNSTVAGSSLYAMSTTTYWNSSSSTFADVNYGGPVSSLVNTGSWRCVSPAGGASGFWGPGLWVRYA